MPGVEGFGSGLFAILRSLFTSSQPGSWGGPAEGGISAAGG